MPPSAFPRRSPPPEPLSPADRWLAAQSALLIVASSWAGGGRLEWAPALILGIALSGWLALLPRFREGRPLRPLVFAPLALWLGLSALSLLNPSHVPSPRGWVPRPEWVTWLPTTVDRAATLVAQLPWLAALLQGTVLAAVRPDARAVRFIWTVAAINGFALAATGALFHFAHSAQMLGFIEPPEATYFFATFFYKNHWAAYGALGAMAGAALALRSWPRTLAGDPRARGRLLFFGVTCLLTAITLPLPGSRAGALLAGMIVLGGLATLLAQLGKQTGFSWKKRVAVATGVTVLVLGCAGYGAYVYADKAVEDWTRTTRELAGLKDGAPLGLRTQVSHDTARMAEARPWFGWGAGSFGIVFPLFQGDYLRDKQGRPEARFEFAHNDWLQLAAETGLAGLLVLLVPLGLTARRTWRAQAWPARWGLAGCGVLLAYAWIDFPFNNPAVLVLWTLLFFTAGQLGPPQTGGTAARAGRR